MNLEASMNCEIPHFHTTLHDCTTKGIPATDIFLHTLCYLRSSNVNLYSHRTKPRAYRMIDSRHQVYTVYQLPVHKSYTCILNDQRLT